MRFLFIIYIFLFSLCSYAQQVDLHQEEKISISFSELPEPVQIVFDNTHERHTTENGKDFFSGLVNPEFTCLDTTIVFEDASIQGKAGVRPGIRIFKLNNIEFTLTWNANREQPPFIVYKGILYFTIEKNIYSEKQIKSARCEYIDLNKYLE